MQFYDFRYLLLAVLLSFTVASSDIGAETLEDAWNTALAADHRVQTAHRQTASAKQQLSAARAERLPNVRLESGWIMNRPFRSTYRG